MSAISPKGYARAEQEYLTDLLFSLIGRRNYATIEGLFNKMAADVPAFKGLTWAAIGDAGVTVPI